MTSNLMISALRQGNNGAEILNILDAITSVDTEKETVVAAIMPSTNFVATNFPVFSRGQQLDGNHRVNAVATLQEIAF